MNEITRIHIAKTAYDIEIAAKKQLEKYIKSLETYTSDSEVVQDIEIRMTELLAERGVAAGGVISSDDVSAIRKQLGEPYEFADGEGDMAVGPDVSDSGRRLYRSTDNAVLGGVLSGVAAYFNVNPLWTRLVFVLLLFISFGTAALIYVLFWIVIPPARTATEKLQLVGKDVTVESIRKLNSEEESAPSSKVAPILQTVLALGLGTLSLLAAVVTFICTIWLVVGSMTMTGQFMDLTNSFAGLGDGNAWIVWLVFSIVIFGLVLLAALFGLIAYAFFKKKFTKKMFASAIIIIVLGIGAVISTIAIGSTQSVRIANEARNMVQDTKANLPKEFASVKTITFKTEAEKTTPSQSYFSTYSSIRYIVDEGPARYELSALPTAKPVITVDGEAATITLKIPQSFRNSFVQPTLTVYGPAIDTLIGDAYQVEYLGTNQDALTVVSNPHTITSVSGVYQKVGVEGAGTVDLGTSTIVDLTIKAQQDSSITAGTVRTLNITQPDVCPTGTYGGNTVVSVADVTSGEMTYNGAKVMVDSRSTSCAGVVIESKEEY